MDLKEIHYENIDNFESKSTKKVFVFYKVGLFLSLVRDVNVFQKI